MSYPLPGDFGLLTTRQKHTSFEDHIAEWAISWGTDSPAFHAFVCVGSGQIVEAVRHVQVSEASCYENITWCSGRLPANLVPSSEEREEICAVARSYVGEKYGILDIVAIALAQKRLGRTVDGDEWWVKRLSDEQNMKICSQLVAMCYQRAGITLVPGRLPGLISPGDLYSLLLPALVP